MSSFHKSNSLDREVGNQQLERPLLLATGVPIEGTIDDSRTDGSFHNIPRYFFFLGFASVFVCHLTLFVVLQPPCSSTLSSSSYSKDDDGDDDDNHNNYHQHQSFNPSQGVLLSVSVGFIVMVVLVEIGLRLIACSLFNSNIFDNGSGASSSSIRSEKDEDAFLSHLATKFAIGGSISWFLCLTWTSYALEQNAFAGISLCCFLGVLVFHHHHCNYNNYLKKDQDRTLRLQEARVHPYKNKILCITDNEVEDGRNESRLKEYRIMIV